MNVAIWVAIIGGIFSLGSILVNKRMEKRSINIAVLAEIQRLLHVLESHKGWYTNCSESEKNDLPLVPFDTPVYDAQIDHVGGIDRQVVAKVVAFYSYVKFINALQETRDKYPHTENLSGQRFCTHYASSLDNVIKQYGGAFDDEFTKYGIPSSSWLS